MIRKGMRAASAAVVLGLVLACGGGSKFGSVELQTYKAGRSKLVFNMGGRVKRTWANMSGDPVVGEYTQSGEEIEIHWPKVDNFTGRVTKLKQTGPCAITQYYSEGQDGSVDDDPRVFERTKPLCDSVQLR